MMSFWRTEQNITSNIIIVVIIVHKNIAIKALFTSCHLHLISWDQPGRRMPMEFWNLLRQCGENLQQYV